MYNEKQGFLPKLLKLKTFGRITRFAQMQISKFTEKRFN